MWMDLYRCHGDVVAVDGREGGQERERVKFGRVDASNKKVKLFVMKW
jgi:hypothetical protein